MKKHRFLIIAIALSILFHILLFIFAPELKSEINSNDYIKKITKISIFQEPAKPQSAPKQENAPRDNGITGSRDPGRKRAIRNHGISGSRDHGNDSTPRDNGITGSRDHGDTGAQRDHGITGSRDPDSNSAPRDNGISESRDPGNNSSAPKKAGELAIIPKALNPKTPPYPESLEDEGIEGSVTLELLISKEGKVLKAKVIKSDHELFSESALKTVKNYRFSAGKLKDGSAVDSLIEFVIKFEISL